MKAFAGLATVGVAITVFLLWRTSDQIHLPNVAKEVIAAMFGSVITIMITATLLRAQSNNEVARDKSVGVFNAKLRLYNEFCEFLNGIAYDERVDEDEQKALQLWAMKLSLISGENVSDSLDHFFRQSHKFGKLLFDDLTEAEKRDLEVWHKQKPRKGVKCKSARDCFISIGELVSMLKHDLGESKISSWADVASCRDAIDDILSAAKDLEPPTAPSTQHPG